MDRLVEALRANTKRNHAAIRRAARIRKLREEGRSYRDIVGREGKALLIEVTRENLLALAQYGSVLRRVEARALYSEGLTMEQIAELYGVTRQRVGELLKPASADSG
jgi:hypothetical protein